MAIRSNHYDAAFEEFLRARCVPYVAVDESRRALLADSSIKSFDFIVEAEGPNLLVDVKGRRWGAAGSTTRRWENWATEDDIASLLKWEDVFGDGFRAALVFAYAVDGGESPPDHASRDGAALFGHGGRSYFFTLTTVRDYALAMKRRSAGWRTVTVSAADYQSIRRPVEAYFRPHTSRQTSAA